MIMCFVTLKVVPCIRKVKSIVFKHLLNDALIAKATMSNLCAPANKRISPDK